MTPAPIPESERWKVRRALDGDRRISVRSDLIRLLGPRDAILLQQMRWHCDVHGYADVSAATLATETGLTGAQAKAGLARIIELGLVVWEEPERFSRRRVYRLALDETPPSTVANTTIDGRESDRPDGRESDRPPIQDVEDVLKETSRGDLTLIPPSAGQSDALSAARAFEDFWTLYPQHRHVEKRKASDLFKRALVDTPAETILHGLTKWVAYWQARNEPQFVPWPVKWITRRQWEADPGPARQDGAKRANAARPIIQHGDQIDMEAY